ncbi:helix-turn-helix domain-containing protein [Leclercia adecarboxylata]|uniref:helix-turn-helix domain-containing protein n=1 Tax=Leclercia adecarboxylata TaxID=83655 RepID=UPI002949D9AA|nr:helix-turn-helix domain-containing protein [Leclercia adecarboxylata]MDV5240170.1 helix-turn-helix domain-containing protein [Leclercia adecarboxylata]MDV5276734.1 helix-turn-helix domain-containing protein [Leclercia adecarboxylata]MDV5460683.1 helix-turn-helix domain-containing protein [Leclercia adecarboxylata]MDV5504170.1 helix-turn-helix domain-containing protein [Leclercia adecarboxylata]MDV5534713.1 helix-turn-helix domain-containing protein [Leclercia adecarboxylata]
MTATNQVMTFTRNLNCIDAIPKVNGVKLNGNDKRIFSHIYTMSSLEKVFPSIEYLMFITSTGRNTVLRSLSSLESCGLISVTREQGKSNLYDVNDALIELLHIEHEERLAVFKRSQKEARIARREGGVKGSLVRIAREVLEILQSMLPQETHKEVEKDIAKIIPAVDYDDINQW